jgi:hypothetical protein
VLGRFGELVDKVSEVGEVEVHKFVDVGKTDRTAVRGRRGWRPCAAENVGEGIEEMGEKTTVSGSVSKKYSKFRDDPTFHLFRLLGRRWPFGRSRTCIEGRFRRHQAN